MEQVEQLETCRTCGGKRLKKEINIGGICDKCWDDALYPEFSIKEFKGNE